MKPTLLLGREPSVILGCVAIAVQFVSAFVVNVSQDTQTAINAAAAALVGFLVAYLAHSEGSFAAFVGLGQAALALAMNLGLHWTGDKQTAFMALFTILGQFWLVRDRITAPVTKEGLRLAA